MLRGYLIPPPQVGPRAGLTWHTPRLGWATHSFGWPNPPAAQNVIRLRTGRHGLPPERHQVAWADRPSPLRESGAHGALTLRGAMSGLGELLGAVEFRRDYGEIG